jgi:hypothetical protein
VNGLAVQKFNFRTAAVTGPQLTDLVTANGLTLAAACEPGTTLTVRASTNVSAFAVGESFDVLDNAVTASNSAQGTLTYLRPDGGTVTATFLGEETGTSECIFSGTVTG